MEKKLQNQFDDLEFQRIELLNLLQSHAAADLNKKPAENKWNTNQIIHHLILAEELSCKSIKAKVDKGNFEKASVMSRLRELLLKLFLRSTIRFKAPAAVSNLPENLDFLELCTDWSNGRLQLKELLESLPEKLLDAYIFKHPAAGKMTIYGGLTFMQEHLRRHAQQIKKINYTNEKF